MRASQRIIDFIKDFESLSLIAYRPVEGDHWTIGYGSTSGVHEGMRITKRQAMLRLKEDLRWAEEAVNDHVKVELTQGQFDALVSFVFNIGETAFYESSLLRLLNEGQYSKVDHQLSLWVNGGRPKKKLPGLVRRRRDEANLFDDFDPSIARPGDDSYAVVASHSKEDHSVTDTVAESRTAKSGLAITTVGAVDGGIEILNKLGEASGAASNALTGLLDPSLIVPVAAMLFGLYIVYLKHTDKKEGRSY